MVKKYQVAEFLGLVVTPICYCCSTEEECTEIIAGMLKMHPDRVFTIITLYKAG